VGLLDERDYQYFEKLYMEMGMGGTDIPLQEYLNSEIPTDFNSSKESKEKKKNQNELNLGEENEEGEDPNTDYISDYEAEFEHYEHPKQKESKPILQGVEVVDNEKNENAEYIFQQDQNYQKNQFAYEDEKDLGQVNVYVRDEGLKQEYLKQRRRSTEDQKEYFYIDKEGRLRVTVNQIKDRIIPNNSEVKAARKSSNRNRGKIKELDLSKKLERNKIYSNPIKFSPKNVKPHIISLNLE
jgi:hypothetical protein